MKQIFAWILITFWTQANASNENTKPDQKLYSPSDFTVTSINSPVKEAVAKFKIIIPTEYVIDTLKIKIVNANDLYNDQKPFENIPISGTELQVPVTDFRPGFYRLYVRLKKKNERNETKYSSSLHDFVRFEIDNSSEVATPDPNLNKSTIAGVDQDNNGIRDDIQRFINQTYPKEKVNLPLKQYARSIQSILISKSEHEAAIFHTSKRVEALRCLSASTPEWAELSRKIVALTLNTEARIKKNLENDRLIHGESTPQSVRTAQRMKIPSTVFCDFEK